MDLYGNIKKFRATKTILDALVERLRTVKLSDEEDAPAFERVELFDLADWRDAMRRLQLNQQRLALVIWAGDEYENNRETTVLMTQRTQLFEIFLSEKRLDRPVAALTGDDRSPGVLGLKDSVVKALTGVLIEGDDDNETIYVTPTNLARGIVSDDDKKENPGRQVLVLSVSAAGEYLQNAVGESPNY
jgi:hypothetical protein